MNIDELRRIINQAGSNNLLEVLKEHIVCFVKCESDRASFELWARHSKESCETFLYNGKEHYEKCDWQSYSQGFIRTINSFNIGKKKMPLCIQFNFSIINDQLICFFYPCSDLVIWSEVEKYVEKYSDNVISSDYFHEVFDRIKKINMIG